MLLGVYKIHEIKKLHGAYKRIKLQLASVIVQDFQTYIKQIKFLHIVTQIVTVKKHLIEMKEILAIATNYPLHILNWLLIKMLKNKLV